jgi:OOP family OmpA-OmpF porin
MKAVLAAALLTSFLALAAQAAPPTAASHVDPDAPCYRWPASDWDGDGVFDRIDRCNDTPKGCTVDAYGCSVDQDGDGVCDGVDRCPDTPAGMEVDEWGCSAAQRTAGRVTTPPSSDAPREVERPAVKPQPASRPVSESERQLVESGRIRLENIYFETASARLLPESEASLREAGEALEKFPELRIEVEGHTDTRGSNRFNQTLSQDRSGSVRDWLLANFRLRPENLIAKGYGESRPETAERNEEELLRNRRVVLTVLNPEALPRGVKVENRE